MKFRLYLITLLAAVTLAAPCMGNTTSYWKQAGLLRFFSGEFDGAALTQDGRIVLGRQIEEFYMSTEQFLWSAAYDRSGNLWVGSSNKGILFRVDKKGEARQMAVLPGVGITSITVDSKDNIYAAVMPGGQIFKVTQKGDFKLYSSVMASYIWDMEFDSDGVLYCVTGLGAGAYKIDKTGLAELLYSNAETHFLSMFLDGKGNLYTGTAPSGLILKINLKEAESMGGAMGAPGAQKVVQLRFEYDGSDEDRMEIPKEDSGISASSQAMEEQVPQPVADPRVKVLLDMEEDEAYRLLPLPDGRFLVAANRNQMAAPQQNGGAPPRTEPLSFPRLFQPGAVTPEGQIAAAPARLYILTPEGRPRLVLEIPDPYIMSLHLLNNNEVLVGTGGSEGRIYTLDIAADYSILQSIPAKQVLAMAGSGDNLRIVTGNPGAVFAPAENHLDKGVFTSSINDAVTTATYGNLHAIADIPGDASISFTTRSGNTPNPEDGTWSGWSTPRSDWPFKVDSGPGRYIQYKAVLKKSSLGDSPRLSETRIYYITENQQPEIYKINILPQPETRPSTSPGQASAKQQNGGGNEPQQQGPPEQNLTVGTIAVSSEITFQWEAVDPDKDKLKSKLEFRRIPSSDWVLIDDQIYAAEYKWQTDSLPDGSYEIKLTVSDEDANTPDRALSFEMNSAPFMIDHTRPEISIAKTDKQRDGGYVVTANIADPTSTISSVEYSFNDLEWKMAFPEDMIFDSSNEKVVIKLDKPDSDRATLIIRATDFVGNTGSESVQLGN